MKWLKRMTTPSTYLWKVKSISVWIVMQNSFRCEKEIFCVIHSSPFSKWLLSLFCSGLPFCIKNTFCALLYSMIIRKQLHVRLIVHALCVHISDNVFHRYIYIFDIRTKFVWMSSMFWVVAQSVEYIFTCTFVRFSVLFCNSSPVKQ